jgi:hypothetical protein
MGYAAVIPGPVRHLSGAAYSVLEASHPPGNSIHLQVKGLRAIVAALQPEKSIRFDSICKEFV